MLDEFFPEFTTVFADPLGQAAMHLLRNHQFPADVLVLPTEQLAMVLKEASNRRVGLKRAPQLQEDAKDSIGISEGLQAARLRLRQCLDEVEFWKARLDETEAAMTEALRGTGLAPFLLSVPGVGVVTVASLLGEAGDLNRYEAWRQLRKLAGYNLTENSSGQQQSKTRISKRGRPGLRCFLYQAALSLVAKNAHFKALYQHLKTQDQNRLSGKQALIAVACKLLRVLFTLARERRLYDPAKVLGEYRTNQLGLAA